MSRSSIAAVILIAVMFTASLQADPPVAADTDPAVEAPAAPKTVTVEAKRMKIEIGLSGVFEAATMTPLSLRPEAWGNLTVERAVPAGTAVAKGDQVLWLNMEDIDEKLADIEASETLTVLAIKQAQEELRLMEKTHEAEMARARRTKRIADEEYSDFVTYTLGYQDRWDELDMIAHALNLDAAEEEMRQLQEMYEADELIEETEEMVMKRNDLHLKRVRLNHEIATLQKELRFERNYLRRQEEAERRYADSGIAWERAQFFIPLALQQKREQVAKILRDREKALESLVDLQADRAAMIVRAPADGIVYYGRCVRGQWPTAGQMDGALQLDGRISANQVFMTIVQPNEMFIRAAAGEKDLRDLHVGNSVKITPTGYPDHKLGGRVSDVVILPPGPGQFTVKVAFDGDRGPIMPGMTCKLKLVAYDKADAVVAPAVAVFSDEDDDEMRFVFLVGADGDAVKTPVTVGRQKGDDLEILSGLSAGDELLAEKPDDAD
jgi:HlyD family secretion protein